MSIKYQLTISINNNIKYKNLINSKNNKNKMNNNHNNNNKKISNNNIINNSNNNSNNNNNNNRIKQVSYKKSRIKLQICLIQHLI